MEVRDKTLKVRKKARNNIIADGYQQSLSMGPPICLGKSPIGVTFEELAELDEPEEVEEGVASGGTSEVCSSHAGMSPGRLATMDNLVSTTTMSAAFGSPTKSSIEVGVIIASRG